MKEEPKRYRKPEVKRPHKKVLTGDPKYNKELRNLRNRKVQLKKSLGNYIKKRRRRDPLQKSIDHVHSRNIQIKWQN